MTPVPEEKRRWSSWRDPHHEHDAKANNRRGNNDADQVVLYFFPVHVFSPFNSQLKTSAEAGPTTKVSRIASVVMCSSP
jgi:hypothetical protein